MWEKQWYSTGFHYKEPVSLHGCPILMTHDYLMTTWRPPDDCLTSAWWLPEDHLTTAWRLPDESTACQHFDLRGYLDKNVLNPKYRRRKWRPNVKFYFLVVPIMSAVTSLTYFLRPNCPKCVKFVMRDKKCWSLPHGSIQLRHNGCTNSFEVAFYLYRKSRKYCHLFTKYFQDLLWTS